MEIAGVRKGDDTVEMTGVGDSTEVTESSIEQTKKEEAIEVLSVVILTLLF